MRRIFYLFGILNDADVDWLSEAGKVINLEPSAVLIYERRPIDKLYILIDGKMEVQSRSADKMAMLYPGDVIGEMSFVDSRPPTATVVSILASKVLAVPRHDLELKLGTDLEFASRFYYAIARFLADRFYASLGRFGYGPMQPAVDPDELPDNAIEAVDVAAVRFDTMLRKLA
jgi:CRP/FNR family cyclic AMP-dependent transcriptional regulator